MVSSQQALNLQKDYLPVRGLPALREAVADFHRRRDGLAVSNDDVLIGPGSKELMFLARDYHVMRASYSSKGSTFASEKPQVWSPTPVSRTSPNFCSRRSTSSGSAIGGGLKFRITS